MTKLKEMEPASLPKKKRSRVECADEKTIYCVECDKHFRDGYTYRRHVTSLIHANPSPTKSSVLDNVSKATFADRKYRRRLDEIKMLKSHILALENQLGTVKTNYEMLNQKFTEQLQINEKQSKMLSVKTKVNRRKRTSLETRRKFLQRFDELRADSQSQHLSITACAARVLRELQYPVTVRTAEKWIQRKAAIRNKVLCDRARSLSHQNYHELDSMLYEELEFLVGADKVQVPMCCSHLLQLALMFTEMLANENLKYADFVPNKYYIKSLCRRFGLKHERLSSIREKTEPTAAQKSDALDALVLYGHQHGKFLVQLRSSFVRMNQIKNYSYACDFINYNTGIPVSRWYSGDETAFFPHHLLNSSMVFADRPTPSAKPAFQTGGTRYTVFLAYDFVGGRRPPFIIGRSVAQISKVYRSCCEELHGAAWSANKTAWMTRCLFKEHLKAWDDELITNNDQPVLLIVDNVSTHHGEKDKSSNLAEEMNLQKIHMLYLPPSSTSTLQIMDVGLNHVVKAAYRSHYSFDVLATLISNIQEEKMTKESFAERLYYALNAVKSPMVVNTVKRVFGDRIEYNANGEPTLSLTFMARNNI